MYSPIEKNPITQNEVFQEMLRTERTYNKSLNELLIVLKKCNTGILARFKPLLLKLKGISDTLLTNVEQATDASTEDGNTYRVQRRQLLIEFFTEYKAYAPLYSELVKAIAKDPKPFEAVDTALRQINKLGLESYLILAVQRGPRYLLLISALKPDDKTVDKTNQEELEQLKSLVAELLTSANESVSKDYVFGDYTKALIRYVATLTASSSQPTEQSGYKFGDFTRGAIKKAQGLSFFSTKIAPDTTAPQNTDALDIDDFALVDNEDEDSEKGPGTKLDFI